MVNQFTRLRDGDRFFYLNEQWSPAELKVLEQGDTLAQVIEANSGVTNLQRDVFLFQASISGRVLLSGGTGGRGTLQGRGLGGLTVRLEDASGDILATTVTDRQGFYSFNQLSGPSGNAEIASGVSATGSYNVVLILPSGFAQTSVSSLTIPITRGSVAVTDVDFALRFGRFVASDEFDVDYTDGGSCGS